MWISKLPTYKIAEYAFVIFLFLCFQTPTCTFLVTKISSLLNYDIKIRDLDIILFKT